MWWKQERAARAHRLWSLDSGFHCVSLISYQTLQWLIKALVNWNRSSACTCHLVSWPFTGRQWQLCFFGKQGSWPEASLHTMLISGKFPGGWEENCGTEWQQELLHAKTQTLFLFLHWKWEQKEVLFPWANIYTFPFGSVPAKDFFQSRKTEINDVTPGIEIESSSLISVRIVHWNPTVSFGKSLYYSIHQASVYCLFVSVLKAFLKISP